MLKTPVIEPDITGKAVYVTDPVLAEEIVAERAKSDAHRRDEVWEGVYVVTPQANNEHQELVTDLANLLKEMIGDKNRGRVYAGANVSDRKKGWEHNYREPDVVVVLQESRSKDCGTHFSGGPDFIVEILSEGDPAREKIPFYGQIGVRELLIVDRDPWALELLRLKGDKLEPVGRSTLEDPAWLASDVIPLRLRLQPGEERPMIEATPADNSWSKRI